MWYTVSAQEVIKKLRTNLFQGLSETEAQKRKEKYGENKLAEPKKENIFIRFLKQFKDFMIIILLIASGISALIAKWEGTNDYIDSIIILTIVVLNSLMGVIQEAKAEKSLEALKKMSAPVSKVKRNGKIVTIKSTELVPGDIISLEAGNYVPADCRLISSSNLKIEESSLTGETVPTLKEADIILNEKTALGDMSNMAFATTIVVNGHAEAVVTETGMQTRVGKIANMIISDEAPETPIQKKLGEVGKTLGIGCLIICAIIFVIGLLKNIEPIEMFMTSVGLAVAAIPEGLPAVVTIMLSIGVTKMAKNNSIIRKLPAVETLGSSSVICSDKTGTLTQNKMQVTQIIDITGKPSQHVKEFALELGTMCTDVNIEEKNHLKEAIGEATEVAIANCALQHGKDRNELYQEMERVADIPFDSERKLMTTVHKIKNGYRVITKGAPDVLLERCNKIFENGQINSLSLSQKAKIEKYNRQMAEEALRVIAVGYYDTENLPKVEDIKKVENNIIFVGLLGMIDPPREGVKEAVETCRKAGIKTVMITGDHILTATAIAKKLGILRDRGLAITGTELDNLSQKELEQNIMQYSVFARVTPEHKVRIVKAFQSTGAVVAMTGDGVNDAPALKNADIGIAMGKNGTDVAKNASDMILTDDNFITIVEAVKQGRNIFDNIKKAVHFLIATNIGEIATIFLGLLLGIKSPLLAIQLLWINLVTDSFPAIALGMEPASSDIMIKKPRDNKKSIFADGLWGKILIEGTMLGILTLFAFSIGNHFYGIDVGRTMAFVSLGFLELVHSFNMKSELSIFKMKMGNNPYLIGSFLLGIFLQVTVVMIPGLSQMFKLVPLVGSQWLIVIGISIMPIIIIELQKKFNEIKFGKVVHPYEMKLSEREN